MEQGTRVCGRKVWRRSGELITGTVSIRTMMDALRTLFLVSSILVQEAYGRYPGLCCGLLRPTMGWSPLHFPSPPHPSLPIYFFGDSAKARSSFLLPLALNFSHTSRARYVCPSIIQNDAVRSAVPKQSASSTLPYSRQNRPSHPTYCVTPTSSQPTNVPKYIGIPVLT